MGIALVLVLGRIVASFYVEFAWFRAMGATDLWWVRTANGLALWSGSVVGGALFLFANMYAVRRSIVSFSFPRRVANLEIGQAVPGRVLNGGLAAVSLVIAGVLAAPRDQWPLLALVRHGIPFGESDPVFQIDLGNYVYWLPFERAAYDWATSVLVAAVALVVLLYALTPSLRWSRGVLHVTGYVRRHIAVLGALILLMVAWSYRLDAFGALLAGSGIDGPFTPADQAIALRVAPLLAGLSVLGAFLVLWMGWKGQLRVALSALVLVLLSCLAFREAFPSLAKRFAAPGEWTAAEVQYTAIRAAHSRRAFGADEISMGSERFGPQNWTGAVRGVSLWDPEALMSALQRGPPARSPAGNIAWTSDSGSLVAAVAMRPASVDSASLIPWSVARVRVTEVDDLGGVERMDDHRSTLTLVFPGAPPYLVVSDSTGRVVGADVSAVGSRLAYAWSQQDFRLLTGTRGSWARAVLYRDVRARLNELVPFLVQGSVVVPVLAADTILWAVDLYSASSYYPLSHPLHLAGERRAYFHHAATALVNGLTGRVTLVRDATLDSIATTWVRMFPTTFTTWRDVRPDVAAAVPVAIDGAIARAEAFASFGIRGENAPGGSLAWSVAPDSGPTTLVPVLVLLQASVVPGVVQIVLDAGERIRGVLVSVAGGNGPTIWYPLAFTGLRWRSLLEHLDATVDSGRDAHQEGVRRGAVQPVPVGRSVSLMRISYVASPTGALSVYRTAVLSGDSLRVGRTLAEAMGAAVGTGATGGGSTSLQARLATLYERMRAALRRGDWLTFGAAFDSLGMLLGKREP